VSSADDHTPEAYRTLFALIGAAMQATALILIAASALVAPAWAVVALGAIWLVAALWSWVGFPRRAWLPTAAGTLVAALWVVVIVGAG
jgi:hypothetical protein